MKDHYPDHFVVSAVPGARRGRAFKIWPIVTTAVALLFVFYAWAVTHG